MRAAATQDSHFPALIGQNRAVESLVSGTQIADTYLNAAMLNLRDEVLDCLQESVGTQREFAMSDYPPFTKTG